MRSRALPVRVAGGVPGVFRPFHARAGWAPSLGLLACLALPIAAAAEQRVVYEKESAYNTILVTEDERGLRTLQFERDGARQSVVKPGDPDHLELPYSRVMAAGMAVVEQPRRVLIVGLGGGTIPVFLHKHFPQTTIDVVDIDPDVVQVAKDYFGFKEDSRLRAHVGDGRRFIEECRDPYDVVFLDAFGSDNIPLHLTTREFLQATTRALKPGGAVIGNIWGPGSNRRYDSMVRTYQDVFAGLCIVNVQGAGNRILVALPKQRTIDHEELARRAGNLSREKQWRFDLGDLVRRGIHEPDPQDGRSRVLRDGDQNRRDGASP